MRKQRYQRHLKQQRDPKQVNTSTHREDAKILKAQVEMLGSIWKDRSDGEDAKVKKGLQYAAVEQKVHDLKQDLVRHSTSTDEMTKEREEEISQTIGGGAYLDLTRNGKAPLQLVINGDKTTLAAQIKNSIIAEHGEDAYENYIAYSYANQPIQDKAKNLAKIAASIPATEYTKSYFSDRGIDLKPYFKDEASLNEFHEKKLMQASEAKIDSTQLTKENFNKEISRLRVMTKESGLTDPRKKKLHTRIDRIKTRYEQKIHEEMERNSEKIKHKTFNDKAVSSEELHALVDKDVNESVKNIYTQKVAALDSGRSSWADFKTAPKEARLQKRYYTQYQARLKSEYREIMSESSGFQSQYGIKLTKELTRDKELAVSVLYSYYQDKKRQDPEYSIGEARKALFRKTDETGDFLLLTNSLNNLDKLNLDKKHIIKSFRTEAGRKKLRDLLIEKKLGTSMGLNYNTGIPDIVH